MDKSYILRCETNRNNSQKDYSFVVLLNNNQQYYLTHNPNDATRFEKIGDAMNKSVELHNKNKDYIFQAIGVWI